MLGEQLNGIAHMDLTDVSHVTIQRKFASEFLDDLLEHTVILLECVGVEGGHDATAAQVLHADQDISDAQVFARPWRSANPSTPPITMLGRSLSPS
jgi:hypothetical protein